MESFKLLYVIHLFTTPRLCWRIYHSPIVIECSLKLSSMIDRRYCHYTKSWKAGTRWFIEKKGNLSIRSFFDELEKVAKFQLENRTSECSTRYSSFIGEKMELSTTNFESQMARETILI